MSVVLIASDDLAGIGDQILSIIEAAPSTFNVVDHATRRYSALFKLHWAQAREGLRTPPGGLPYVGHLGVQAAMGEVPDAALRPIVDHWYEHVHAPDVLTVPGVAVALGFRSHERETSMAHLVLFLLDEPPEIALAHILRRVPEWRASGRSPSPGGASRSLFHGPFVKLSPDAIGLNELTTANGELR
jgi:hypothetical protein